MGRAAGAHEGGARGEMGRQRHLARLLRQCRRASGAQRWEPLAASGCFSDLSNRSSSGSPSPRQVPSLSDSVDPVYQAYASAAVISQPHQTLPLRWVRASEAVVALPLGPVGMEYKRR